MSDDAFVIVLVRRSLSWRQRRLKSTDAPSSPFSFAARHSTLPTFLPLSAKTTIRWVLPCVPPLVMDDVLLPVFVYCTSSWHQRRLRLTNAPSFPFSCAAYHPTPRLPPPPLDGDPPFSIVVRHVSSHPPAYSSPSRRRPRSDVLLTTTTI